MVAHNHQYKKAFGLLFRFNLFRPTISNACGQQNKLLITQCNNTVDGNNNLLSAIIDNYDGFSVLLLLHPRILLYATTRPQHCNVAYFLFQFFLSNVVLLAAKKVKFEQTMLPGSSRLRVLICVFGFLFARSLYILLYFFGWHLN